MKRVNGFISVPQNSCRENFKNVQEVRMRRGKFGVKMNLRENLTIVQTSKTKISYQL